MKLIRCALPALVAAAFLTGGAGQTLAQKKTAIGSFGALTVVETDKAQSDAKAWLKSAGKDDAATLQKFDAVWKQTNRSVLDKVAETFKLGSPAAAKLLTEAANPQAPAPTAVNPLFTDKNASAFFKSNLALAYARLLTQRRVFEQALDVLKTTKAEQVSDPGSYLFHVAVCQHGLLRAGRRQGHHRPHVGRCDRRAGTLQDGRRPDSARHGNLEVQGPGRSGPPHGQLRPHAGVGPRQRSDPEGPEGNHPSP